MSDEQTPSVDDLKEQEKLDTKRIVIEEDEVNSGAPKLDIGAEFQKLGRQLAETLQSAWDSEERKRVEKEVREGVHTFVNEVDKVIREVKTSETTEKNQRGSGRIKDSRRFDRNFGPRPHRHRPGLALVVGRIG